MQAKKIRLLILTAAFALPACWEPKAHDAVEPDDPEGATPGGPWSTCQEALEGGLNNDTCTFEGGCNSYAETYDPGSLSHSAFCESGRLYRSVQDFDEIFPNVCPQPDENGFYEQTLTVRRGEDGCLIAEDCTFTERLCQPDELLPPASGSGPLVVLETEADCAAVFTDPGASPGVACTGEFLCAADAFGVPFALESVDSLDDLVFPAVWCASGRLRHAYPVSWGI